MNIMQNQLNDAKVFFLTDSIKFRLKLVCPTARSLVI